MVGHLVWLQYLTSQMAVSVNSLWIVNIFYLYFFDNTKARFKFVICSEEKLRLVMAPHLFIYGHVHCAHVKVFKVWNTGCVVIRYFYYRIVNN